MDTAAADELRTLRARIYGPGADLHDDPDAVRRLHELESLRKGSAQTSREDASTSAPVAADEPAPIPDAEPLRAPISTTSPETATPDAATPEAEQSAPPARSGANARRARRSRPRRVPILVRVLWIASIAITAAVAASVTYALVAIQPVSTSNGAPQIATLRPSTQLKIPSGWMGAGSSSLVYEFYGLALFETAYGMQNGAGDCLMAIEADQIPEQMPADNSWSASGTTYGGCAIGSFPASISLLVNSSAPKALHDRYSGHALQFVKQGDVIGVFLDEN